MGLLGLKALIEPWTDPLLSHRLGVQVLQADVGLWFRVQGRFRDFPRHLKW